MKKKITILAALFLFIGTIGFAQEKTKKQIKKEKAIEIRKQIEELVNSKEFVFTARMAMPTGFRTVNLTTNSNYVKYHPDRIESYMPFYGKAYSGIGYGGDQGLKFEGAPEEYTITREKKNYRVVAKVKGNNDTFRLSLTVGFEGGASLTINSNNRSSISYHGEISAPTK